MSAKQRATVTTKDYNSIRWNDYFYLDETSPSGIRWKVDRLGGRYHTAIVAAVGDVAGNLQRISSGRPAGWRIKFNGISYFVHRVIYVMLYGSIDANMVIDHLNGDGADNTIQNLVLKSQRANLQNRKMHSDNTSGVTGVRMITHLVKGVAYTYWVARWVGISYKPREKTFSVNKYGYNKAKVLAISYRNEQIKLLNEQGQDYTNRSIQNQECQHKFVNKLDSSCLICLYCGKPES